MSEGIISFFLLWILLGVISCALGKGKGRGQSGCDFRVGDVVKWANGYDFARRVFGDVPEYPKVLKVFRGQTGEMVTIEFTTGKQVDIFASNFELRC